MKVLSLFDGISCGMVALERAGIPVERYVAYEIDENAIFERLAVMDYSSEIKLSKVLTMYAHCVILYSQGDNT